MSIYLIAFLVLAVVASLVALIWGLVSLFCNMGEKHPVAAHILGGATFTILLYLLTLAALKLKSSGFHIDILQS